MSELGSGMGELGSDECIGEWDDLIGKCYD